MLYQNQYYTLDFQGGLVISAQGRDLPLELPQPEVDGQAAKPGPLLETGSRPLENGAAELTLRFPLTDTARLDMLVRCYPGSPFLRVRYRLGGEGGALTKPPEGDSFPYTTFRLDSGCAVTELQLNQYESTRHAYLPHLQPRPETAFATETVRFAGPALLAEEEGRSLLCAYEHGGEYTDDFLRFAVDRDTAGLQVRLECGDGTYCNGQPLSDAAPYLTPWFHIGVCPGGREELLPLYRRFLLRELPETPASRAPYIFYNTWNNQERNRAFRGRKYLQDMNTRQMCKEVEIAHRVGVDVFVIDTGWYRSTGDWEVDLDRFPDDLREVRALLDRYGMQLGLWFNPAAAAVSSRIARDHPEYRKQLDGKDVNIGPVWETEESFGMCLASDYAEWFIEKLVELGNRYGVRYFKWDAVDMSGCNAPHHHHGGPDATPEQREKNFRFRCGMALTHIAEEVSRRLPGAIVDLDVTEGRRYVGLGFLAAGKFFHMNNGPYYHDFDIPGAKETYRDNWNAFFHPGTARSRVCRQALAYDGIIPSILFLTHFLPDQPVQSQKAALASLMLGGNGIWGDLLSLEEDDIHLFAEAIAHYKEVAAAVTAAYPRVSGFIGSSPEIHEKLEPGSGGIVVFFTREPADVVYYTQPLLVDQLAVEGADHCKRLPDGRLRLEIALERDDSRVVFVAPDRN